MQPQTLTLDRLIQLAQEESVTLGQHGYVSVEHLLLAMVSKEMRTIVKGSPCIAIRILIDLSVDVDRIRPLIMSFIQKDPTGSCPLNDGPREIVTGEVTFTPWSRNVFHLAQGAVKKMSARKLGTENLLLGIMTERNNFAGEVLREIGVKRDYVGEEVVKFCLGLGLGPLGAEHPEDAIY